ncbi:hypothetical protein [Roseibium litorale]|uniref:Phage shock protein B n=1 Tax=Roseibium litorale TaxID=2803841 RepID=A0ABR9CTB6_9HYPH|nr:hypothetical protein [Roseibium litorale]MBD8894049.1 hypothetical protein [Roseibium litorale]
MTGPITWDQVTMLVGLAVVLCGAWWFLFSYVLAVKKELHEFRLEVAKDYASQRLLKDLEKRVVLELKELREEFHVMPERLAALLRAAKHD